MKNSTKIYKIILGLVELFFSIPILGGSIIILNGWTPLGILIVLHIIGLVLSIKAGKGKVGHIVGIIGNALGFIPIVGMLFHVITGLILLVEGIRSK